MHTVPLNNQEANREPIPGYRLRERIGVGGYGEVWSSEAPGGLEKAIKFVFGELTEDRAKREMKSLSRIKEVHHPFLLSLERIEVVDGQLVIVTELAEGSLKDRFDKCVEDRLPGIPHRELLRHLRDAADALDYIFETQSLQHLDIKPENLLLLGGRVKVADFGLLKDLNTIENSLMDGLTPKYAAPELFDGRPSRHSDQYSLAIVYQEMLTGISPFDGRTCAQLAVQHLHRAPNVESLPWGDRAIIERALAKSPDDRFPDCRSFVDELINGSKRELSAAPTPTPQSAGGPAATIILPASLAEESNPTPEKRELQIVKVAQTSRQSDTHRPSVLVGLGSCGAEVLNDFQVHLDTRLGPHTEVPCIGKLFLDTDADALQRAAQRDSVAGRRSSHYHLARLRSGKEYSAEYQQRFRSIDRRWIYNIPRSRQTEGIRALGRLAVLDNYESIYNRIHEMLRKVISPESVEITKLSAGIEFSGSPQIIVVSSLGGGAGSGMLIDVAYLIRHVLHDLQVTQFELGAITALAATTQRPADLSAAAAHSLISELKYFSSHPYPGDPANNVPGLEHAQSPYDYFYVQEWGMDLRPGEYKSQSAKLAAYLEQRIAGATVAALSGTRRSAQANAIRTLSLVDLQEQSDFKAQVCRLNRSLVNDWLGHNRQSNPNALNAWQARTGELCRNWIDEHLPNAAELIRLNEDEIARRLEFPLSEYFERFLSDGFFAEVTSRQTDLADYLQSLELQLNQRDADSGLALAQPIIREIQLNFSQQLVKFLDDWTNELADTPQMRIGAVRMAMKMLRLQLDELANELSNRSQSCRAGIVVAGEQMAELLTLMQTKSDISKDPQRAREHMLALGRRFTEQVLNELVSVEITRSIRLIQNHLEVVVQRSRMWQANLELALKQMADFPEVEEDIDHDQITGLDSMVAGVSNWKLSQVLDDSQFAADDFVDSVQVLASKFLQQQGCHSKTSDELAEIVQNGMPKLATELGGSASLFWVLPAGSDAEAARQKLIDGGVTEPSVVHDATGHSSLLIWEVSDIAVDDVAHRLLDNNPVRRKMSDRLVTRVDLAF